MLRRMSTAIESSTLQFLADLRQHNQREWFQQHKARYEQARDNFVQVLRELIDGLAQLDPALHGLSPSACVFRIYRDIRFSPNKMPYKWHLGAYITPQGKNSPLAGFYLHVEPGSSMFLGGIYMAPARTMQSIREDISYYQADFMRIMEPLAQLPCLEPNSLVRTPRGFEPGSPVDGYLRMRNICPTLSLTDAQVCSPKLLERLLAMAAQLHPLNEFINRAIANS